MSRKLRLGTACALTVLSAPLLAAGAQAAEFYLLDIHDGDASVIAPAEIVDLGGGHRTAVLNVVQSLTNALDATKFEADCTSPQWRILSEAWYDLSGELTQLDKSHLNEQGWKAISEGTVAMSIYRFVCNWPNVSEPAEKFEDVDIWALARRMVPALEATGNGSE